MKFTREQVIEMALQADGGFDPGHINIDAVSRLCTLAADAALEAAAKTCEQRKDYWSRDDMRIYENDCSAAAIRAMKEKP